MAKAAKAREIVERAFVVVVSNDRFLCWDCERFEVAFDVPRQVVEITAQPADGEPLVKEGLGCDATSAAARLALAVLRGDETAALALADLVQDEWMTARGR
jgi:hypothetical protein